MLGAGIMVKVVHAVSGGCYWLGGWLVQSAGRSSHGQPMGCALGHDMVAEFQAQERERDRESGRSHVALYDKPHESQSILSLAGQLQMFSHLQGEGMVTPPLEGRLVHATLDMWSGTYIGMTVSRENIIFHGARGVGGG